MHLEKRTLVELILLMLIVLLAFKVNASNEQFPADLQESDVIYEYFQAAEVATGKNPYTRIHGGDLLKNQKYATLLPFYYYALSFISLFSGGFEGFLAMYKIVLSMSEALIATIIYLLFKRYKLGTIGLVAVMIFLFNRWTLRSMSNLKQDIFAVSLLISSLYFFTDKRKRYTKLSFLIYGLSVGVKYLSLMLSPLYLLRLWEIRKNKKAVFVNSLLFLIPTLGFSLPFILDDPLGLFYSLLVSFTREPDVGIPFGFANSLILYKPGVENNSIAYYLIPRIPFFISTLVLVILAFLKKIPIFLYTLAIFIVFIAFSPVLFYQYFVWFTPFVLLPILDD